MALPPDEWHDREKVNAAVRDGLRLNPGQPRRQCRSPGLPKATD
jgi:hypothetical protein